MTDAATVDAYGVLTEPTTLKIQRLLPGPVERCWAYLTESELRRQWLASGEMEMREGAEFELVWRNDELTDPPGQRPPGFEGGDHSMQTRVTEFDPPRKLAISWGSTGGVSFELQPVGDKVLLTLIHARITDRATRLNVSAGWHAHLDILAAKMRGEQAKPFWESWSGLKDEYDGRLPA